MNKQLLSTVAGLKSTVSHNVAQNLVSDKNYDMYAYLNECAELLFNMEIPADMVHDIIVHVWNHAPAEAEMVHQMNERYGIKIEGHGGSAIKPEVMLEVVAGQLK